MWDVDSHRTAGNGARPASPSDRPIASLTSFPDPSNMAVPPVILGRAARSARHPDTAARTRGPTSHDTVKLHVRHILSKLGLRSRVEAAVFAVEHRAETSSS